jgi:curved DNA-binding protein CbpA
MNEPDPYETLQISHSANAVEIKRAYRTMARKYHPDKYVLCVDETVRYRASTQFALCAAAYALLSDAKRKAEYDHIYKYGGFDAVIEEPLDVNNNAQRHRPQQQQQQHYDQSSSTSYYPRKRKTVGIGYACHDPCAFLWTQGKLQSRQTVAGVQIPSRLQSSANDSDGFRFAFSSGRVVYSPSNGGSTKCISETTQYYPLGKKKITTTETITYHRDGRKEVLIVDGDGCERQYSSYLYPNLSNQKELPWYSNAWKQVQDKLSMCFNPCAAVEAQQ